MAERMQRCWIEWMLMGPMQLSAKHVVHQSYARVHVRVTEGLRRLCAGSVSIMYIELSVVA